MLPGCFGQGEANDRKSKATLYLQQLDSARCSGDWERVPECARKVQKHAPGRKCGYRTPYNSRLMLTPTFRFDDCLHHRVEATHIIPSGSPSKLGALAAVLGGCDGTRDCSSGRAGEVEESAAVTDPCAEQQWTCYERGYLSGQGDAGMAGVP